MPRRGTRLTSGESLAPLHLASASSTKTTAEQHGQDGQPFLTIPHVRALVRLWKFEKYEDPTRHPLDRPQKKNMLFGTWLNKNWFLNQGKLYISRQMMLWCMDLVCSAWMCVGVENLLILRTDHRIRVCDFVYLFLGSFVSVACSGALCSCVRPSHPRPSHAVGTGVPWVSMPGPTSVPSDAQAGWHRGQSANSVLCSCCVVAARAFDNLELWSW